MSQHDDSNLSYDWYGTLVPGPYLDDDPNQNQNKLEYDEGKSIRRLFLWALFIGLLGHDIRVHFAPVKQTRASKCEGEIALLHRCHQPVECRMYCN